MATTTTKHPSRARPGDWIEVHGLPGCPARHGQIIEVLGGPGHERFRVRWDETHESIFFPSEGVRVVAHRRNGRRGA